MKTLQKPYFYFLFIFSFVLFAQTQKAETYRQDVYHVVKFKTFNAPLIKEYQKAYHLKRYFSLSDEVLLSLKKSGEKSGVKLADLRTYFKFKGQEELYQKLKKDPNIFMIYKDYSNLPQPSISKDIPPKTPNWSYFQTYLGSFDEFHGFHAKYAWNFEGGKGEHVIIADIERGWYHDHEDLNIKEPFIYNSNGLNLTGTPATKDFHHGTSVLGMIASTNNKFGMIGMAHEAEIKVVCDASKEYGYSTADAILRAIYVLEQGSIILLESQKPGPQYKPNEENPQSQFGLVPDEWLQAEFDAIKTATANGFIIVEAGANGEQNLDDPIYHTCTGDTNTYFTDKSGKEPCFDLATRDSGAILVGAGVPPNGDGLSPRSKMYYTSYGKRVDVQAWGAYIYTLGYGDLFFPNNDVKQTYTSSFGGTSGASPIIASVAGIIQSRYKYLNNNYLLTSQDIRRLLKDPLHSHPQTGNLKEGVIGPQPDIERIFRYYFHDHYNACSPKCEAWETCDTDQGLCLLQAGKCSTQLDCTSHMVCNENHDCINPCESIECQNWETCNMGVCVLKEGKCDEHALCSEKEACDLETHACITPCASKSCPSHASCQLDVNRRAECVCETGYGMNNQGVCQRFNQVSTASNVSNCSYTSVASESSTDFFWKFLTLLLLSLFFYAIKKLKYKA